MKQDLTDLAQATSYYDHRYGGGYMDAWPADKLRRVEELVAALNLPQRGVALDYGCGTGVFTSLLQRTLPGWQIVGTEISGAALEAARHRCPTADFFGAGEGARWAGRCDFVFSHHVLEHVGDLDAVADDLAHYLRPSGFMLHIMPCGNPGSLERSLCARQRDGIDPARGNRFFFEDEGHLRRLTSDEFSALWTTRHMRVVNQAFSNQFFGAIRYYTEGTLSRAMSIADPGRAKNQTSRLHLASMRALLAAIWLVRRPLSALREKRRSGVHSMRDVLVIGGSMLTWPAAALADGTVRALAEREWRHHRTDPRGTEMYVVVSGAE